MWLQQKIYIILGIQWALSVADWQWQAPILSERKPPYVEQTTMCVCSMALCMMGRQAKLLWLCPWPNHINMTASHLSLGFSLVYILPIWLKAAWLAILPRSFGLGRRGRGGTGKEQEGKETRRLKGFLAHKKEERKLLPLPLLACFLGRLKLWEEGNFIKHLKLGSRKRTGIQLWRHLGPGGRAGLGFGAVREGAGMVMGKAGLGLEVPPQTAPLPHCPLSSPLFLTLTFSIYLYLYLYLSSFPSSLSSSPY